MSRYLCRSLLCLLNPIRDLLPEVQLMGDNWERRMVTERKLQEQYQGKLAECDMKRQKPLVLRLPPALKGRLLKTGLYLTPGYRRQWLNIAMQHKLKIPQIPENVPCSIASHNTYITPEVKGE